MKFILKREDKNETKNKRKSKKLKSGRSVISLQANFTRMLFFPRIAKVLDKLSLFLYVFFKEKQTRNIFIKPNFINYSSYRFDKKRYQTKKKMGNMPSFLHMN